MALSVHVTQRGNAPATVAKPQGLAQKVSGDVAFVSMSLHQDLREIFFTQKRILYYRSDNDFTWVFRS